jgi:hypothetical protein
MNGRRRGKVTAASMAQAKTSGKHLSSMMYLSANSLSAHRSSDTDLAAALLQELYSATNILRCCIAEVDHSWMTTIAEAPAACSGSAR